MCVPTVRQAALADEAVTDEDRAPAAKELPAYLGREKLHTRDYTAESALATSLGVGVREGMCLFSPMLGRWHWNRASLIFPEF